MDSLNLKNESESQDTSGIDWETATCILCGATESRFVMSASHLLYDRPGQVRIVRCIECGHYYQNPRPTRETIGLCYPQNYGPHVEIQPTDATPSADGVVNDKPWYLRSFVRSIPGLRRLYYGLGDRYSEMLPTVPNTGRALEIGSGSGRYLEKLQQQGWDIEGIEPALEPGERCRARGLPVRTGVFEDFDFQTGHYNAVISWMVIEHLHDPVAALREIRRILQPDGVLVFSVPNVACWETWFFRGCSFILNEPTHLHHFTPHSLKRLLFLSGFTLNRLHYQENLYNVVGSLGICLLSCWPNSGFGRRLLEFCESPTMSGRLALAPFAKLAAALRQTGRVTIVATPRLVPNDAESAIGRKEDLH